MIPHGTPVQIPSSVLSNLSPRDAHVRSVDEAYAWCRSLATSHYENFPVASLLLPKAMRRHLWAVYAFSRVADDIADEPWTSDATKRLLALDAMEAMVLAASLSVTNSGFALSVALSHTMLQTRLSPAPFIDLLNAFRCDCAFQQPETWDALLAYCALSANPVGRVFLILAGEDTPEAQLRSDNICTALQLVNFWQDLSVDMASGRTYIPRELTQEYGMERSLPLVFERTAAEFARGFRLPEYVKQQRLRWELRTIIHGGMRMLEKAMMLGPDCTRTRPTLQRNDALIIAGRVLVRPAVWPWPMTP